MHVHHSMDHLPEIPFPVVTVGSFDGVHVGHRAIIGRLKELAVQVRGASVLITFHPHPRRVLYPHTAGRDLKLINSKIEKCKLLEEAGLNHLIIINFTKEFASTTSEEFVKHFLVRKLHAHTIVVGFNHYFGHNKEGSFESLYRVREQFGFRVEEIPAQEIQNETVSSTKIRKALIDGSIQRANAYLEYHFMVQANLKLGVQLSEENGHPCYEVVPDDPDKLIPPVGWYAVSYPFQGERCKGLIRISEGNILLFPLEKEICIEDGDSCIRFHKRIIPNGIPTLKNGLKTIFELIY